MVDIQSATAEIRRGKNKKERRRRRRRRKKQDENIMSPSATQGGHKKKPQGNSIMACTIPQGATMKAASCIVLQQM